MREISEFFTAHGQGLGEIILSATGQPPTPPVPPHDNTSSDLCPPNPQDFGFYVSFQYDKSLQKLAGPNSWGLYLSKEKIVALASCLVTQGCSAATALETAHEFIKRTVEIEYLADCTFIKFDHIGWLYGSGGFPSQFGLGELPRLRDAGMARAHHFIVRGYGANSTEELVLRGLAPKPRDWIRQLSNFFLEFFHRGRNNGILVSNPLYDLKFLIDYTLKPMLVTATPKKSPIGTDLPVHYIP